MEGKDAGEALTRQASTQGLMACPHLNRAGPCLGPCARGTELILGDCRLHYQHPHLRGGGACSAGARGMCGKAEGGCPPERREAAHREPPVLHFARETTARSLTPPAPYPVVSTPPAPQGLQMAMRGLRSTYISSTDWGIMVGLYVLMNTLRLAGVIIFFPILRRGSYGIDTRQGVVLAYSGLRGAVGLTLAIAIHQDSQIPIATRDRILFHVAGASLLSLLVNGTTLKPLITVLGLDRESPAEVEVYQRTSIALEQRIEDRVMLLKREPFLGDADWGVVWRYLPVLTKDVYWHRFRQGHTLLTDWEAEYMSLRSRGDEEELEETVLKGQQARRQPLRRRRKAQLKAASVAAAQASASNPLSAPSKLKGVPNRLRRTWRYYAQLYNDLDGPEREGFRQLRAGLLDAWRNHLTVEGHMKHEQEELASDQYLAAAAAGSSDKANEGPASQLSSVMSSASSVEPPLARLAYASSSSSLPVGQEVSALSFEGVSSGSSKPISRRRMSNVTVLWEPEIEGLKLENSRGSVPCLAEGSAESSNGVGTPQESVPASENGFHPEGLASHDGTAKGAGVGEASAHTVHLGAPPTANSSTSDTVKVLGPALQEDMLKRARVQVLTVLKHLYGANFHSGLLSNEGYQALEKNLYKLILDPGCELNEWRTLEREIWIPLNALRLAKRLSRSAIIRPLANSFLFSRLAFLFGLAVNFIKAHRSLAEDLGKILGAGPTTTILEQEIWREIEDAQRTIEMYLPIYPNTFNSVKTEIATSVVLQHFRSLLEESHEMGILHERRYHKAVEACNDATNALSAHSHSEHAPSYASVLSAVGFLRFLPSQQLEELFLEPKPGKRRLFADVYVRANRKLLKRGLQREGGLGGGWYVVVRGVVAVGDVILPQGSTLGLVESLLGEEVAEDYVTTTLTHLLFFDQAAILQEAESNPLLLKSLWWYVAVQELRQYESYEDLNVGEVGELLADAHFVQVVDGQDVGGMGEGEGKTWRARNASSLRLLSLSSIRLQLENISTVAGQSLRLPHSSTVARKPSRRHQLLRVWGSKKDVLILKGGIRGPSLAPTPKNSLSGKHRNWNSKEDLPSAGSGMSSESALIGKSSGKKGVVGSSRLVGNPLKVDSLSASASTEPPKRPPMLLSDFQGEVALEVGSICFVIQREEASATAAPAPPVGRLITPAHPTPGSLAGKRGSTSRRDSAGLQPLKRGSEVVSGVDLTPLEPAYPPGERPLSRERPRWKQVEEMPLGGKAPFDVPIPISKKKTPSSRSSQHVILSSSHKTPRSSSKWAQTVTLQDFLDSACGEIDVEAAKKALAKGETLAGFLSRRETMDKSAEGGGGGSVGTPPRSKQRVSSTASSPLTTLFSRADFQPARRSQTEEVPLEGDDVAQSRQARHSGQANGRKPTALELMFMDRSESGGNGRKETQVARGDDQV